MFKRMGDFQVYLRFHSTEEVCIAFFSQWLIINGWGGYENETFFNVRVFFLMVSYCKLKRFWLWLLVLIDWCDILNVGGLSLVSVHIIRTCWYWCQLGTSCYAWRGGLVVASRCWEMMPWLRDISCGRKHYELFVSHGLWGGMTIVKIILALYE